MENNPGAYPGPGEPASLLQAIRYYADLEIVVANSFDEKNFSWPAVANWSVWSVRRA